MWSPPLHSRSQARVQCHRVPCHQVASSLHRRRASERGGCDAHPARASSVAGVGRGEVRQGERTSMPRAPRHKEALVPRRLLAPGFGRRSASRECSPGADAAPRYVGGRPAHAAVAPGLPLRRCSGAAVPSVVEPPLVGPRRGRLEFCPRSRPRGVLFVAACPGASRRTAVALTSGRPSPCGQEAGGQGGRVAQRGGRPAARPRLGTRAPAQCARFLVLGRRVRSFCT